MEGHFHFDAPTLLWTTAGVVVVIKVLQFIAAMLIDKGISFGTTLGSVVSL